MASDFRDERLAVGHRQIAWLMRENDLIARQKCRFTRTSDSRVAFPGSPNRLEQDSSAECPNQKWNADISYVSTSEG